MKASGSPTILGSERNNTTQAYAKTCNELYNYAITELDFENNVLTIYQNPNNVKYVRLDNLASYDQFLSRLDNNKVDKTFVIETTDGLYGGGDMCGSKLTISLKSADPNVYVDKSGIKVLPFTEVDTSGTVPATEFEDDEHFLTSAGSWIELNKLEYKGEINKSTGFPNPSTLKTGMLYKISNLGSPEAEIEDVYTGDKYHSNDVLLWDGTKWVIIGKSSSEVNLSLEQAPTYININNSNGKGVTLPIANETNAGLFSAAQQTQFNLYKGVYSLNNVESVTDGVNLNYIERVLSTGQETSKSIIFPAATDTINGVLIASDKNKLNNLPETIISVSKLEYDGSEMNLINTVKNINTGLQSDSIIPIPLASYEQNNYKNGLISGENVKKLDNITDIVLDFNYEYDMDALNLVYNKYNSNTLNTEKITINFPLATHSTAGLLSKDDKIKLDTLISIEERQSDWKETDVSSINFIKNKPVVLTTADVDQALIPSTINLTDKHVKFLNANGEWVDSNLSKPIITVSSTEPTDEDLKVDGAIWIQTSI